MSLCHLESVDLNKKNYIYNTECPNLFIANELIFLVNSKKDFFFGKQQKKLFFGKQQKTFFW